MREKPVEVRLWEDYADNAFPGLVEGIFIHDGGWRTFEPERLQQMHQQIQGVLTRLEKHLEGKRFLVHGAFSLTDICFAPGITHSGPARCAVARVVQ